MVKEILTLDRIYYIIWGVVFSPPKGRQTRYDCTKWEFCQSFTIKLAFEVWTRSPHTQLICAFYARVIWWLWSEAKSYPSLRTVTIRGRLHREYLCKVGGNSAVALPHILCVCCCHLVICVVCFLNRQVFGPALTYWMGACAVSDAHVPHYRLKTCACPT